MNAQIAPAVLAETTDQFKQIMEKIHQLADRVHIDIADGEFAPTFTIGPTEAWWPEGWHADIHAMVARPSEYVDQLIALRADLFFFHAEVLEVLLPTIQKVKAAGMKAGIALQRRTVPSTVAALIQAVDHVMIFSGDLGHYGGTASLMQLEKVKLIRAIKPDVEIGWDGGVTLDNAFGLTQGGVEVLNIGGTIEKSADPAATYNALVAEINKHSVI
jgi:ribulose-phosphate 3-epimerase